MRNQAALTNPDSAEYAEWLRRTRAAQAAYWNEQEKQLTQEWQRAELARAIRQQ